MIRKFLVFLLLVCGVYAWAGANRITRTHTLTITGSASGQDSVATDTFELANTQYYGNRLMGIITMDSQTFHDGVGASSFGLVDTVELILKSLHERDGFIHYKTLDSVKKAMASATLCTLLVIDGVDSLFGERISLIARVADTVGVTTDSTATFRIRVDIGHYYID